MSLRIEKTKSEWMVAEHGYHRVSVCVRVENGEVKSVQVNGFHKDGASIYTDMDHLRNLYEATREILEEVKASQERTRPPGEKET